MVRVRVRAWDREWVFFTFLFFFGPFCLWFPSNPIQKEKSKIKPESHPQEYT